MMRPLGREQQTFKLDTHRYLGRIQNLKSEGAPVLAGGLRASRRVQNIALVRGQGVKPSEAP